MVDSSLDRIGKIGSRIGNFSNLDKIGSCGATATTSLPRLSKTKTNIPL